MTLELREDYLLSGMTVWNRVSPAASMSGRDSDLTRMYGWIGGRSAKLGTRCRYTVAFSRSAFTSAVLRVYSTRV